MTNLRDKIIRVVDLTTTSFAIASVITIFVLFAMRAQGQDANALTELEHTKLQLIQEKLKTVAATAALIRDSYDKNQQEGRQLVTEQTLLLDSICQAHGMKPNNCQLAPDGNHVTVKTPPAEPPAKDPKASGPAPAKK